MLAMMNFIRAIYPGSSRAALRGLPFLLLAASTVVPCSSALAFAELERAQPRVGATVSTIPQTVTLTFSEALRVGEATVEIRDEGGARVDIGGASISSSDPHDITIKLKRLTPGVYTVSWWVTKSDHDTQGRFQFSISH